MKVNLSGKIIEVTVLQNVQNKNEYEYYIGDVQIGELNKQIMQYENIIMRDNIHILEALKKLGVMTKEEIEKQNTLENELSAQLKDIIDTLEREEIEKSAIETKELNKYIDEIGIDRKKIKDVRFLDLDEEEKEPETQSQKNKEKNEEKDEEEQDKKTVKTTKNTNILSEIKLSERANDMHDIRKWLDNRIPKNIKRIGVVYSEKINEMKDDSGKSYHRDSTRYALVVIGNDGKVEPLKKYIPELEQRSASGDNPVEQKYQVRDDGSVEKDSILSEYEIGDKIIQLDNKEMGRVEMNIGEEARDSTETLGVQVRDDRYTTFATDTSTRAVIGEYEKEGEDAVEMSLEEAKTHEKEHEDCTQMTEKDIDGDPSTKSEHVMEMEEEYIKECAREILDKNPELGEIYNQQDIENKLKEKVDENEYSSKDDLENNLDEITEDLEKQAENERVPGQDSRL